MNDTVKHKWNSNDIEQSLVPQLRNQFSRQLLPPPPPPLGSSSGAMVDKRRQEKIFWSKRARTPMVYLVPYKSATNVLQLRP